MRRLALTALVVVLTATSCGGAGGAHVVRVDYQHDEFASHYWRFFPRTIYAHPGDEVLFRQEWTGEPHSVTLGTLVDRAIPRVEAVERKYADVDEDSAPEVLQRAEAEYEEALGGVPTFFPYHDAAAQNAATPCYLPTGRPPTDPDTPCPPRRRHQPEFNGLYTFYSSGFIPPSGPSGNTYTLPLADDIEPGTYRFYCNIHFPSMQGRLVVRDASDELRTQSELNRQTRAEIQQVVDPLRRAFAEARRGEPRGPNGELLDLPVAGYHSGEEFTVAIDEFVPKRLSARVNEPITWTISGAHTISFGVPRFVPIYTVNDDGTLDRNPVVDKAAGGSPDPPRVDFRKGPVEIDGGTWDGSRFISSGLLGSEPYSRYTLRVSKPGRYRYACLVHPKMVGTLAVHEG